MKRRLKGDHTWDLYLRYHRCPHCGFIIESREDYRYRLGEYVKELSCSRCRHHFVQQKHKKQRFGPLFNTHIAPEVDWGQ